MFASTRRVDADPFRNRAPCGANTIFVDRADEVVIDVGQHVATSFEGGNQSAKFGVLAFAVKKRQLCDF